MDRDIEELRTRIPALSDKALFDMFNYFEPPERDAGQMTYDAISKLLADEIKRRGLGV